MRNNDSIINILNIPFLKNYANRTSKNGERIENQEL